MAQVFGRILRGGVRAVVASQHQEAEELQLQRDLVEEEHQKLRRQYEDQAEAPETSHSCDAKDA
ncbi:hypothetical protein IscW_ISCW014506 [Ixodes scapularis]|uniref:Uncharacterized protein n=1 Tax=Ixodes scapularis TaxID=6945 RepID=B7QID3_IXOSC|nr:hypothetical protein IscW_ISCW014506 [Ixodes scapularis]|eukprot:XP_002414939.1 hypothetical protein IscW_ISCW014506 [Ixodes scapularis]